MKNLSLSLSRVSLVLATAFSLGACSRADYAPLTRTTTQPASMPVAQAGPYVPVANEASASVKATAPVQPIAAAPVAVAPALATPSAAPATSVVAQAAPAVAVAPQAKAATAPKLNLAQRLALRKITKKLDKLANQAPQFKQRDASAASGIDGNLRSAILFGLIGLIVLLFSGVSAVFGIVGTILLIIGLVFLVLWVLDQA
jgi:hypothetical protein